MTARDFERVAARIHRMAGIVLEPHKKQMIYSRLSRRLRARGMTKFQTYLDLLDDGSDPEELQAFVNTLTTNLTSLFREAHHFGHLESHVLAELKGRANPRLRIWSAGCSSGEEPYSVALSILETLGQIPGDVMILATDLDTRILETGRAGLYRADKVANSPKRYARHLITRDAQTVAMPPAARKAISFRRLNLLEPWPMNGLFKVIFCRNVLIYFDSATKASLVNRLAERLEPGGFLYLGHSESLLGQHPLLDSCGDTIYRRRDA
ncbi:CheR family methyltransferase [Oceanibium sediminis]|uniref:CheR family methyltransferase n=1 Tax=Oceanibium sediminis TaxID=2026339 RepID=UPI000DD31E65|nr:protein-glutamate O-methyltransferase CheR [Oceanibium sediminis]